MTTKSMIIVLVAIIVLFAAFMFLMSPPAKAWVHPAVVPIVKIFGGGAAAGGGAAGGAIVGGAIGGAGILIVAFDKRRSCLRRSDTWVDGRHDMIPSHKPWRNPCDGKRRHRRVAPAEIVPFSK